LLNKVKAIKSRPLEEALSIAVAAVLKVPKQPSSKLPSLKRREST
jgi:hypothetical protein